MGLNVEKRNGMISVVNTITGQHLSMSRAEAAQIRDKLSYELNRPPVKRWLEYRGIAVEADDQSAPEGYKTDGVGRWVYVYARTEDEARVRATMIRAMLLESPAMAEEVLP